MKLNIVQHPERKAHVVTQWQLDEATPHVDPKGRTWAGVRTACNQLVVGIVTEGDLDQVQCKKCRAEPLHLAMYQKGGDLYA